MCGESNEGQGIVAKRLGDDEPFPRRACREVTRVSHDVLVAWLASVFVLVSCGRSGFSPYAGFHDGAADGGDVIPDGATADSGPGRGELTLAVQSVVASGYCIPVEIGTSGGSAGAETIVTLSDNASGAFHATAACNGAISQTILAASATTQTVYYAPVLAGASRVGAVQLRAEDMQGEATATVEVRAPITHIGVGSAHSCFAVEREEIYCAGDTGRGAVGRPVSTFGTIVETPHRLSLAPAVVTVVNAGLEFSCAIVDSSVQCWGNNRDGQLGNSKSTVESSDPLAVVGLGNATSLAVGTNHACAVVNGGAWCWGGNGDGELGADVGADSDIPVQVEGLSSGVRSVGAGSRHSCALLTSGEVRCWGPNFQGQLGTGSVDAGGHTPRTVVGISGASALSVKRSTSCVVVGTEAWCWGVNDSGQLGSGAFSGFEHTPQRVIGVPAVERMIVGGDHSCVVAGGDLWCWGHNASGVLANGTRDHSATPVRVQLPTGTIEAVGVGGGGVEIDSRVTCVAVDGIGYCWGATNAIPDGIVKELWQPQRTVVTGTVSALSAGGLTHSGACAIVDGAARCWGRDWGGRLGQVEGRDSSTPVDVEGLSAGSGVTEISVGFLGACAVVNGAARCWGRGSYLGNGTPFSARSEVPVVPTGLNANVTAVSAGNAIVCALVDGGVMCWGDDGALGDGPANDGDESLVPVSVVGMGPGSGVTDVSVGDRHACAIQNGGAYCWGSNSAGQLGDGNLGTASNVPVAVLGLGTGVADIKAGVASTCVLTNAGAVHCWGQVISTPRDQPLLVAGLEQDVTTLAMGGFSVCVVQMGALKCWGSNSKGQLGTGDTQSVSGPTTVLGIPGTVEHLDIGGVYYRGYTCAVASGDLYCWGDNTDRQLVTGLPISRETPQLIAPWE